MRTLRALGLKIGEKPSLRQERYDRGRRKIDKSNFCNVRVVEGGADRSGKARCVGSGAARLVRWWEFPRPSARDLKRQRDQPARLKNFVNRCFASQRGGAPPYVSATTLTKGHAAAGGHAMLIGLGSLPPGRPEPIRHRCCARALGERQQPRGRAPRPWPQRDAALGPDVRREQCNRSFCRYGRGQSGCARARQLSHRPAVPPRSLQTPRNAGQERPKRRCVCLPGVGRGPTAPVAQLGLLSESLFRFRYYRTSFSDRAVSRRPASAVTWAPTNERCFSGLWCKLSNSQSGTLLITRRTIRPRYSN
jgi:hypothetical protein